MKGDFSRSTFRPADHYSGVLYQQGRVQVDADWNEQVDIVRHREETTTADVVGPSGGPLHDAGFALTCQGGALLAGCAPDRVRLGAGRYYVDGILCQNEAEVGLAGQPDLPGVALPTAPGTYLAYLDVWERHLTAFERPSIREVALGGPDTATRAQVVWQARLLAVAATTTCAAFPAGWTPPGAESTGRLRARAVPQAVELDDCLVPAGAGYRRLENQLYRVEVHQAGAANAATFTWSRDNGSVLAGIADIDGLVVTIDALSKDVELRFAGAAAVELTDEGRTLRGEPGLLVEVAKVEGNRVTVKAWPGGTGPTLADLGAQPSARRWEAAAQPTAAGFADLEDGVQVAFDAGQYQTGDYWLVPARSLDGTVQWPVDAAGQPIPQPRQGIDHHYCPLALLRLDAANGGSGGWTLVSDCRLLFPPVTELTTLRYVGGDGQEAMPDTADLTKLVALAQPLVVGVSNGTAAVAGARVRFHVVSGGGALAGTDASGDVITGADGIAACQWSVGSTVQAQRVDAVLLDAGGLGVGLPVRFGADLSVAAQVAFDPGTCANLQGDRTVQDAVARLADIAALRYVAGDGQAGLPGQVLEPLTVAVSSLCGLVQAAVVRFTAAPGNGTFPGGAVSVDVATAATGLAAVTWILDAATPVQQATATLTDAGGRTVLEPAQITFGAHLSRADLVGYDPQACASLAGTSTVQEALDQLCKVTAPPAIHVKGIEFVSGPRFQNDFTFAGADLASGLRITFDASVDAAAVNARPVCFVTLDLPFPLGPEITVWATDTTVGFHPTVVAGNATVVEPATVVWTPIPPAQAFISQLQARLQQLNRRGRVQAHLTLLGDFIWAQRPEGLAYLDGEVFGVPFAALPNRPAFTGIRFPSGGGGRGTNLEAWFWV